MILYFGWPHGIFLTVHKQNGKGPCPVDAATLLFCCSRFPARAREHRGPERQGRCQRHRSHFPQRPHGQPHHEIAS